MKTFTTIIRFEYIHFIRNPFKVLSIVLFALAAIYGLQNGYFLFEKQNKEIKIMQDRNNQTITEVNQWYDQGVKGPENKPWIDVTTPTRAIWYAPSSLVKKPSALMPFSIGQAEQFGYYKHVTNKSSIFDADLAEEIANPERLALGTLDFSFVSLYLLPILLIILLFNISGLEKDYGFLTLIEVNQTRSIKNWILARYVFYFILIALLLFVLMLSYALLSQVDFYSFVKVYLFLVFYVALWFSLFYLVCLFKKESATQAIRMASIWLVLCLIIPATVHQLTSLKYPGNYLMDYLDAAREEAYKIAAFPPEKMKSKLVAAYPELNQTALYKDSIADALLLSQSSSALVNKQMKESALKVEQFNNTKNDFIRKTQWINPVGWFQNKLNALTQTDYYAYANYRAQIQKMIDKKNDVLLLDTWNKKAVDKKRFMQYVEIFKSVEASN